MLEDRFVVPKPIVGCLQNENIDTLESEVNKKKKQKLIYVKFEDGNIKNRNKIYI